MAPPVMVYGMSSTEIVRLARQEFEEGVAQKVFARAAIDRSHGILYQVLHRPDRPNNYKHLVNMATFLIKPREERFRTYAEAKYLMGYPTT